MRLNPKLAMRSPAASTRTTRSKSRRISRYARIGPSCPMRPCIADEYASQPRPRVVIRHSWPGGAASAQGHARRLCGPDPADPPVRHAGAIEVGLDLGDPLGWDRGQ